MLENGMVYHVSFPREGGVVEPLIQLIIIARSVYYFFPAFALAPNPVALISKSSSWEGSQAGPELSACMCSGATA